ncbi:hypothetical protein CPB83DRAFT_899059 [Crepidotus variabilis]|uniref:Uncharacterized protein n=1 Tax=Crepidotus variabilis TaxID=179855 RepID=A0A9P6E5X4_9AGAR|nr:hypothetical protein CPB83DRAFT_899059 [Crepidotus variabilis]
MVDFHLDLVFFLRDGDIIYDEELRLFELRWAFSSIYAPITKGAETYRSFASTTLWTWEEFELISQMATSSRWIAVAQTSLPVVHSTLAAKASPNIGFDPWFELRRQTFPGGLSILRFTSVELKPLPKKAWFEYHGLTYSHTDQSYWDPSQNFDQVQFGDITHQILLLVQSGRKFVGGVEV